MATTTREADAGGFAGLGLDEDLIGTLTTLGYEEPTPIQREAIPRLLEGRDLLGQAATGTGKTAAFALPLLQRLREDAPGQHRVRALVLVPTRELAIQVAQAIHRYGRHMDVNVAAIYGGAPMSPQIRALGRGTDVVVATPGRALDHIRRRTLVLDALRIIVLDEADEMLDIGFADDLDAILEAAPAARQTALFSATVPARIGAIARRHLKDPARITIARERAAAGTLPRIRQIAYLVSRAQKPTVLARVLDMESPTSALVFCRTRLEVESVVETLRAQGHAAQALHGGLAQPQRDRVMNAFRSGAAELLVATDVAARGIDVERLSHVVNYDLPSAPEGYVHRIGRTGRAGRTGVAVTLVEPREHRLLKNIERATGQKIEVGAVPTVADLRVRRLELVRASLRESLLGQDLDDVRVVVETLAQEFDVMDVAAAAVKLALQAQDDGERAEEIPAAAPAEPPRRSARRRPRGGQSDLARLFIGAGRTAGVRPADLVGAITREAGVAAEEVGAIEIGDRFALVEIADSVADQVIDALRRTTIRGRRPVVRRDRDRG